MTVTRTLPPCRYGKCGGQLCVFTDERSTCIACLLCGRRPGKDARNATPADRAQVERDAYVHRRRHHRTLAMGG